MEQCFIDASVFWLSVIDRRISACVLSFGITIVHVKRNGDDDNNKKNKDKDKDTNNNNNVNNIAYVVPDRRVCLIKLQLKYVTKYNNFTKEYTETYHYNRRHNIPQL